MPLGIDGTIGSVSKETHARRTDRIYRLTEAGLKAYESGGSGLPAHLRGVLGLIETDTHSDFLRAKLRRRLSEKQIFDRLDELAALGLLESEPASAQHDLDFTGSHPLDEKGARRKAA